jgi:hypothetical protein
VLLLGAIATINVDCDSRQTYHRSSYHYHTSLVVLEGDYEGAVHSLLCATIPPGVRLINTRPRYIF